MQTRRSSLVEALCNIFTGLVVAFVATQFFAFIVPGMTITIGTNIALTTVLTVISILRSYLWRRFFNYLTHKRN